MKRHLMSSTTSQRADDRDTAHAKVANGSDAAPAHPRPHLTLVQWNFKDELCGTSRQAVGSGTPETTFYVYDNSGQRTRKVTERQNGTRKEERIYVGGFEVDREFDGSGTGIHSTTWVWKAVSTA